MAQGAFLLLAGMQQVIPLPKSLAEPIVRFATGPDVVLSWNRATVDLSGGLFIEGLALAEAASNNLQFSAESLHLQFSLWKFFKGGPFPLQSLGLRDAALFLPAHLAPSGLNEAILKIDQFSAFRDHQTLFLRSALLSAPHCQLLASGALPLKSLEFEEPAETDLAEPEIWKQSVLSAVAFLQTQPENAALTLRLILLPASTEAAVLQTRLTLSEVQVTGGHIHHLFASGRATYNSQHWAQHSLEGRSELTLDASLPQSLPAPWNTAVPVRYVLGINSRESATLLPNPPSKPGVTLIPDLDLVLRAPAYPESLLSTRLMAGKHLSRIPFNASGPQWKLSGALYPHPADLLALPRKVDFAFSGNMPAVQPLFPAVALPPFLEGLSAKGLIVEGSYLFENRLLQAAARIDRLSTSEVACHSIALTASLTPQAFSIDSAHLQLDSAQHLSLALQTDLASKDFTFSARGHIYPGVLDPILGRWWQSIFTQIEAPQPAFGNIVLWGNPDQPNSIQSSVFVRARNARYRDVGVPELELQIRGNEDWADLYQLRADFPTGRVMGRLAWRINLQEDRWRPMLTEFQSSVDWATVKGLLDVTSLDALEFDGPPRLRVSGFFLRPPRNAVGTTPAYPHLDLSVRGTREAFHFRSLSLQGAYAEARLRGKSLRIDDLSGAFSGGVLTGDIQLELGQGTDLWENLNLDLQLFDTSLPLLLTEIGPLIAGETTDTSGWSAYAPAGRVDGSIRLSTGLEQPLSGNGQATLRSADLQRIHLFGGLSRTLDGMGIPLGSTSLDQATLQWRLQGELLLIENVVASGPLLALQGSGSVNLASQLLDITVDANLFSGLFQKLLAPVSQTVGLTIQGSLAEPVWSLRLNPLRWFQNQSQTSERWQK
jgi:hypothetical protein